MDPALHEVVLSRLRQGAALDGLGLSRIDGRWDLRGLSVDSPVTTGRSTVSLVGGGDHEIERVSGVTELKRLDLVDLDLTDARMASVILTGCQVRNCVFDGANLDEARFFGSSFVECTFAGASLRGATIGGTEGGQRPNFERVRFSFARMDSADPGSAVFTDCDFDSARLKAVEFWDAKLVRCRFEGRLENVIFAGRRPVLGLFGQEETLIDVDFSKASFRDVEFRRLNLDRVILPSDPEHIVVHRPRCVVERLLAELRSDPQPDADKRGFVGYLEVVLKWLGPAQTQEVFVPHDLAKSAAGQEMVANMIRSAAAVCES